MTYNPEIHHRSSVRLKEYDYSLNGLYFITVCAQDKKCLFGKITDGTMRLNDAGKIVEHTWFDLPNHNTNINLLEFIIMPNHIHGIIQLVGAGSKPAQATPLSELVRQFKTFSSKRINLSNNTEGNKIWQRNYYEHIIRNQHSYEEISDYIITNPLRWEKDQLFSL